MKKVFPIAIIVLAIVALLVACGKSAEEPHNEPISTTTAEQAEPKETQDTEETQEPKETTAPVNQVEQLSSVTTQETVDTKRIPTEEELLAIFKSSYEFGDIFRNSGWSEEDALEQELIQLDCLMGLMEECKAPNDLEAQYMAWRATQETEAPAAVQPVQQPSEASNSDNSISTNVPGNTGDNSLVDTLVDTSGDLGTNTAGTMDPNAFLNSDIDYGSDDVRDHGHTPIDPSKIIFGN